MKLNALDDLLSKRQDIFLFCLDNALTKDYFLDLHRRCFVG